jgi:drug/metabolite transporter (DMT)-like permease
MMGYLFILGYVVIVGSATFLMKVGLKTINPYQLNFLMGLGMLVTGVPALLIADRSFKLPIKELPLGLSIGVMMAVGSLLYVLAFNKLAAGIASVLAISYVLVVIILSFVFLKESITLPKVFGILLTLLGVGLLTLSS